MLKQHIFSYVAGKITVVLVVLAAMTVVFAFSHAVPAVHAQSLHQVPKYTTRLLAHSVVHLNMPTTKGHVQPLYNHSGILSTDIFGQVDPDGNLYGVYGKCVIDSGYFANYALSCRMRVQSQVIWTAPWETNGIPITIVTPLFQSRGAGTVWVVQAAGSLCYYPIGICDYQTWSAPSSYVEGAK